MAYKYVFVCGGDQIKFEKKLIKYSKFEEMLASIKRVEVAEESNKETKIFFQDLDVEVGKKLMRVLVFGILDRIILSEAKELKRVAEKYSLS